MTDGQNAAPPAGRGRTLFACFLHFDLSFMLWVLVGALGIFIADELALSPLEKGVVVATPIASGTLLRVPLGALADRVGGRRVGVAMLCLLFVPLGWGFFAGKSLAGLLAIGALLGSAGASFSVALPLASRWYPKEKQGLVLGLAAAGNSGAVVTNLLAPRLARAHGWHAVMGMAALPLALALVAFALLARESPLPRESAPRKTAEVLRQPDLLWFCWFYALTFGGYVGLSGFLPLFLRDQYGLDAVTAGSLTGLAAFVGSASRPLGGLLADRVGGVALLSRLLPCVALGYAACAALPSLPVLAAVVVAMMACLGLGNGSVFQLVPQRFHAEMGLVTGIVGAVGGLGGALLPTVLGGVKGATGSFSLGFGVLCLAAASSALRLRLLTTSHQAWKTSFKAASAAG